MNYSIKQTFLLTLCFCLSLFNKGKAQTTLYDKNTIQKIEIYFSQSNWDYMMDTAKAGSQGYTMADWVKINGVQFDSVGVKYKGNSSYNASSNKNPLHINLKKFKSQNYQDVTDIKLANCYQDPSMIREALSYSFLNYYMDCPRSNFAQVYINGAYVGFYNNDEDVDKPFIKNHFYSYSANKNPFFKCSHDNPTPITKNSLKYLGIDSSLYQSIYELKSNYGWDELVRLCDTIANYSSYIENIMDMDRFIWMLAFNNVMVNLDSYTGLFAQNYYLIKDNTNRFNPIMWDLNMCLGAFPFAGSQSGGTGSLTVANMQQLSLNLHGNDSEWPMLKLIINNTRYKKMYVAHMKTIVKEIIESGYYNTLAQQMMGIADTAIASDTNKQFTYAQFQSSLTTNISVGSYFVPGIATLLSSRATFLNSTSEFSATSPTISNISKSIVNNTIQFKANVSNVTSGSVWLGYRFDTTSKFTKLEMFDDGNHNDGASNDGQFGVTTSLSLPYGEFYIYAENANAGKFAPERAEHEFYRFGTIESISTTEQDLNYNFTFYPNPCSNLLLIENKNPFPISIKIIDMKGSTIMEESILGTKTVNTTSLSNGLYFIVSGTKTQKLSIHHID